MSLNIKENISSKFNGFNIEKNISNKFKGFNIVKNGPNNYGIEIDEISCIRFTLYNEKIYVSRLDKCIHDHSSSEYLKLLEELAKQYKNILYIELSDKSELKIDKYNINLAIFKILMNGESWYNSLGYYSKEYIEEKIYNNIIREKNMNDILIISEYLEITSFIKSNSIEKIKKKLEIYSNKQHIRKMKILYNKMINAKNDYNKYINDNIKIINIFYTEFFNNNIEIYNINFNINNIKLKDYFNLIYSPLNKYKTNKSLNINLDKKYKLLIDLIKICEKIFKYDTILYKYL